jgi:tetratricopeptide (TPR) repeat protein
LRGDVNWRAGNLDAALADYNQAIAMEPNAADGYFGRARVLRDKGDKEAAMADLQQFLDLKPNDAANAGIRKDAEDMMAGLR